MITVHKTGKLQYKKFIFKCALGKNGVKKNKIEGDGCTPAGTFALGELFYRSDRIKKIKSNFRANQIKSNMFWSDAPKSRYYNKVLNFKDISCEKLFRKDNIYDILLIIKYNINPIIKYKGSAIFMHLIEGDFSPTAGCIALEKKCFVHLLKILKTTDKITILP